MKGRILLVDDNEAFLDSMKDVVEDEGYSVLTAVSGEEAVALAELHPLDLVVMDIKMPGMNGVDAFIKMKQHNPSIRVIMCTAYIVESTIQRAIQEGARAVLNKPFEMEELLQTIENVLQDVGVYRVLIADRDEEFCKDVTSILTVQGFQVDIACYGPEALSRADENEFDLVILDVGLPLLDGVEVYRWIRERQPNMLSAVIIGSEAELSSDTARELLENSGVIGMKKPLDPCRLTETIRDICSSQRRRGH